MLTTATATATATTTATATNKAAPAETIRSIADSSNNRSKKTARECGETIAITSRGTCHRAHRADVLAVNYVPEDAEDRWS